MSISRTAVQGFFLCVTYLLCYAAYMYVWTIGNEGSRSPSPHQFLQFRFEEKSLSRLLEARCQDYYIVPPIVHFVRFKLSLLKLHEYISLLSASRFLKPCFILIHGDVTPRGRWWSALLREVNNIIHVKRKQPQRIFGTEFKYIEHTADVGRLEALLTYGGIYLDSDVYVLRSFDSLRNRTLTMERETDNTVSNGVIIAAQNSTFLRLLYLAYNDFYNVDWGANSVKMADKLSRAFPSLVYLQSGLVLLGNYESVHKEDLQWSSSRYSVHLYARYFDTQDLDIEDIKTMNNTFGALSRFVLFGDRAKILPNSASAGAISHG